MSRTAKRVATAPIVEVAERPWKGNGVLVWSEKSRAFKAGSVVFQDKYTKNFSAPSKTYRKQHNPKGATWENPANWTPANRTRLFMRADLEKAALQYEARCKHLDKTQQAEEKMQEIFFRGQRRNQLVKAAKARALLSAKSCQQIERHSDNALLRKDPKPLPGGRNHSNDIEWVKFNKIPKDIWKDPEPLLRVTERTLIEREQADSTALENKEYLEKKRGLKSEINQQFDHLRRINYHWEDGGGSGPVTARSRQGMSKAEHTGLLSSRAWQSALSSWTPEIDTLSTPRRLHGLTQKACGRTHFKRDARGTVSAVSSYEALHGPESTRRPKTTPLTNPRLRKPKKKMPKFTAAKEDSLPDTWEINERRASKNSILAFESRKRLLSNNSIPPSLAPSSRPTSAFVTREIIDFEPSFLVAPPPPRIQGESRAPSETLTYRALPVAVPMSVAGN